VSNLAALNDLRREAKGLGIEGASRMKKADLVPAVEAAKLRKDIEASAANEQKIDALRAEFPTATEWRQERIRLELVRMGAVVYPQGGAEHEQYRENLTAELKKFAAGEPPYDVDPFAGEMLPEPGDAEYPATSNVEQEFAAAADADDRDAMAEILNKTVPPVIVRDPNATRYEDIPKWTDERLDSKEAELSARLKRRTLLGGDRKLTESRLARIRAEIASRSN
jgi:Rho termination factor-like protein